MGTWTISRRNLVKPIVAWVLAFAFVVAVALYDRLFGPDLIKFGLGAIILFALSFAVWFTIAVSLCANRLLKNVRVNAPLIYTVSDSGLWTKSKNAFAQLDWPFFYGFAETRSTVLLQLRDKKCIIIPKRCVGEENTLAFMQLLSAELPRLRGLWLLP
jgi:hypothetical protein